MRTPVPLASATPASAIAERAQQLVARATVVEPTVTPLLQRIASEVGGKMHKLEHRVKTIASTERKLGDILADKPPGAVSNLMLDDSLRYTIVIDDTPPGAYLAGVKGVLATLEREGHEVVLLKNYWPAGDTYSGINGVLMTGDGYQWELQFHTSGSAKVADEGWPLFAEMRLGTTPIERRRELFDEMTAACSDLPLPEGILTEGALHPRAEIRTRTRP